MNYKVLIPIFLVILKQEVNPETPQTISMFQIFVFKIESLTSYHKVETVPVYRKLHIDLLYVKT